MTDDRVVLRSRPDLVRRGVVPDVLNDQTTAHDALNGYVPLERTPGEDLDALRRAKPQAYVARSMESMMAVISGNCVGTSRTMSVFVRGSTFACPRLVRTSRVTCSSPRSRWRRRPSHAIVCR